MGTGLFVAALMAAFVAGIASESRRSRRKSAGGAALVVQPPAEAASPRLRPSGRNYVPTRSSAEDSGCLWLAGLIVIIVVFALIALASNVADLDVEYPDSGWGSLGALVGSAAGGLLLLLVIVLVVVAVSRARDRDDT